MHSTIARCEENVIHEEEVQAAQASLISGLEATYRLRLISALSGGELCVCDLAAVLGMTQSAVSHQLRLLRNLQVVRHRKAGRIVYYALEDEHVRLLFQMGLEHIRHPKGDEAAGGAA